MNTFVVTYLYDQDHKNVREQLLSQGAHICAVLTIPFWNIYNQRLKDQFAVVYQSKKELDIEVLT